MRFHQNYHGLRHFDGGGFIRVSTHATVGAWTPDFIVYYLLIRHTNDFSHEGLGPSDSGRETWFSKNELKKTCFSGYIVVFSFLLTKLGKIHVHQASLFHAETVI